MDEIQKVHTQIGMLLSNVSGVRDIGVISRYRDALSEKLITGEVRSLHDLYEAIIAVTK